VYFQRPKLFNYCIVSFCTNQQLSAPTVEPPLSIPSGASIVGKIHSHLFKSGVDNDDFSQKQGRGRKMDRDRFQDWIDEHGNGNKQNFYLATPDGRLRVARETDDKILGTITLASGLATDEGEGNRPGNGTGRKLNEGNWDIDISDWGREPNNNNLLPRDANGNPILPKKWSPWPTPEFHPDSSRGNPEHPGSAGPAGQQHYVTPVWR
jgi:hypothetical protein